MSRPAIVEKLTKILGGSVDSECQVVYILAEVRKLDELSGKTAPTTLRMFLHWALHVDLEGAGTIKTFVERIDDVVVRLLTNSSTPEETIAAENALFKEVTYFDEFRQGLRAFLQQWGIPTGLCDDNDRWFDFLAAYTQVIEDGSLVGKNKQMVETVTFTKGRNNPSGDRRQLAHKWIVFFNKPFNNSHGIELTVQVPPDGKNPARGWHLF